MEAIIKLKDSAPAKVRSLGMNLEGYNITVEPKSIKFKDNKEGEKLLSSPQFNAYMELCGEETSCCDPCEEDGPCENEVIEEIKIDEDLF